MLHLLFSLLHFAGITVPGIILAVSGLVCLFTVPGPMLSLTVRWHQDDGPLWALCALVLSILYYTLITLPFRMAGIVVCPAGFALVCVSGTILAIWRGALKAPALHWPDRMQRRFCTGLLTGIAPILTIFLLESPFLADDYALWHPETWALIEKLDYPLEDAPEVEINSFDGRGWQNSFVDKNGVKSAFFKGHSATISCRLQDVYQTGLSLKLLIKNHSYHEAEIDLYAGAIHTDTFVVPPRWDKFRTPQGVVTDHALIQIPLELRRGTTTLTFRQKSEIPAKLEFTDCTAMDCKEFRNFFRRHHTVTHWEDIRDAKYKAFGLTRHGLVHLPSYDEFVYDGGGPLPTEPPFHSIAGSMIMTATGASTEHNGAIGLTASLEILYLAEIFILLGIIGMMINPASKMRYQIWKILVIMATTAGWSMLYSHHNFSLFPDTMLCIVMLALIRAIYTENQAVMLICAMAMTATRIAAIPLMAAIAAGTLLFTNKPERRGLWSLAAGPVTVILVLLFLSLISRSLSPTMKVFYGDYDERYTTLLAAFLLQPGSASFHELFGRLFYFIRLCLYSVPPLALMPFLRRNLAGSIGMAALLYTLILGLSDHFRIHYLAPILTLCLAALALNSCKLPRLAARVLLLSCFLSLYMIYFWWRDFAHRDFWNGLPVHTEYVRDSLEGFFHTEAPVFSLNTTR